MKKLLAILLSIATLFSLAACNQEDDDDDDRKSTKKHSVNEPVEIVIPEPPNAEPSDEEISLLYDYYYLCCEIEDMLSDAYDQDYLHSMYQRLLDMKDVDRWLQTDFAKNLLEEEFHSDLEVDRRTLLGRFSVTEDTLLSYHRTSYTDNLGNITQDDSYGAYWFYDENGEVIRIENEKFLRGVFAHAPEDSAFRMEYNEDGQPVCKRYYSADDQIYYMAIYNYDENDRIVSEEHRHNTSSKYFYYTYDDQGRLSQILWDTYNRYTLDYVYDDNGNLVKETYSIQSLNYSRTEYYLLEQSVREYTYDQNGRRIGGSFSEIDYGISDNIDEILSGELTFTYDDQGRILSETREYGPRIIRPGEDSEKTQAYHISSETFEYTYGDYIRYTCAA